MTSKPLITICKTISRRKVTHSERGMPISRRSRKVHEGFILEKKIHIYDLWYRYLRLAQEMEDKGIPIPTPKGNIKVIVKRERYKGWDIENILEHRFRDETDWWKHHVQLFSSEPVKEIKEQEIPDEDSERYRYFKIDTFSSNIDIVKAMNELLSGDKRSKSTKGKQRVLYTTTGEVRYYPYRDAYSALIMKINGYSNREVFEFLKANDSRESSKSPYDEDKWELPQNDITKTRLDKPAINPARMRDVLNTAKHAVLAVADGYFPKNPNKKYF